MNFNKKGKENMDACVEEIRSVINNMTQKELIAAVGAILIFIGISSR